MARKAKQTETTVAPAAPVAKPRQPHIHRGFIDRAVDTALQRLIARGAVVNVADIAVANANRTISKAAQAVADELASMAAAAGEPTLAVPVARVQRDVAYAALRRGAGAVADGKLTSYIPRVQRTAETQADASVANAALAKLDAAPAKRSRKA